MPEYRRDPLNGRWVVIAENRANRPYQFDLQTPEEIREHCPFCAGNESLTPEEIDAFRAGGAPNDSTWRVRVVPNRYPAITADDAFPDHAVFTNRFGNVLDVDAPLSDFEEPFYTPIPGVGHHEVIVDTPRHVSSVSDLADIEMMSLLRMFRQRLQVLSQTKRFAYITIFKNVGRDAGASLPHAHSQLMALPLIPPPIQRELQRAIAFRNETRRCYWCEHIHHEIKRGVRVVEETPHFVALCPYVSRFPYEMAFFAKAHVSHFESLNEKQLNEMAMLLWRSIRRLEHSAQARRKKPLAYNLILKTAPLIYKGPLDCSDTSDSATWLREVDYAYEQVYHLHWQLIPSLAHPAGFEWGCGLHINSVSPERAAAELREI